MVLIVAWVDLKLLMSGDNFAYSVKFHSIFSLVWQDMLEITGDKRGEI